LIRGQSELIALSMVPGLGPKKILDLIGSTDSLKALSSIGERKLKEILGIGFKNIKDIQNAGKREEYLKEIEFIENNDINVMTILEDAYPEVLKNIYDPPAVLYCKGTVKKDDENAVAIIGSRKCSVYGMQMAEKLASALAERGVTVVSGMARGIDTSAHRGALRVKGRTIAVMGSGFEHIYPAESSDLVEAISKNGTVITEHSSNVRPLKGNFPRRNRIISGMVKAVVVVEAARKSGAMITVKYALQQGKEVMAVPGRADSPSSSGTHFLIQSGAKLVTCAQDILEELNVSLSGVHEKEINRKNGNQGKDLDGKISSPKIKNLDEGRIVDILKEEKTMHVDQICETSGILNNSLSEILLKMEIRGLVKVSAGKNYALTLTGSKYQK